MVSNPNLTTWYTCKIEEEVSNNGALGAQHIFLIKSSKQKARASCNASPSYEVTKLGTHRDLQELPNISQDWILNRGHVTPNSASTLSSWESHSLLCMCVNYIYICFTPYPHHKYTCITSRGAGLLVAFVELFSKNAVWRANETPANLYTWKYSASKLVAKSWKVMKTLNCAIANEKREHLVPVWTPFLTASRLQYIKGSVHGNYKESRKF